MQLKSLQKAKNLESKWLRNITNESYNLKKIELISHDKFTFIYDITPLERPFHLGAITANIILFQSCIIAVNYDNNLMSKDREIITSDYTFNAKRPILKPDNLSLNLSFLRKTQTSKYLKYKIAYDLNQDSFFGEINVLFPFDNNIFN